MPASPRSALPYHPVGRELQVAMATSPAPCTSPVQRSGRLDKTPEVTGREGQSHEARTPGDHHPLTSCLSVKEGEPKCPSDTFPKWTGGHLLLKASPDSPVSYVNSTVASAPLLFFSGML